MKFNFTQSWKFVAMVLVTMHVIPIIAGNDDAIFKDFNKEIRNDPNSLLTEHLFEVVTLKGKVLDKEGNPLIGVNILVKGTTNGTTTDIDGNFLLENVKDDAILVVSYVGFNTTEISVEGRSEIEIELSEDSRTLDEVVVVGYGTQKKSTVTGSVTDIKADDLVKTPVTNVKGLLIGQVPGLVSNQNPGLPGSDNASLSIRGFGDPLVIVDGIESSLDRLDPNDIETITVLKDASAAIYGARAGNGVILVNTKRGTSGELKINYHGYFATQKRLTFPEQVDAGKFISMGRDAVFNAQFDPNNPEAEISYGTLFTEENLQKFNAPGAPSYDWVNATVKDFGSPLVNNNLSIQGGSNKIRFYTSFGTQHQTGILKGDYDYKKFTITNNVDIDLAEGLKLSINGGYINELRDYSIEDPSKIWNELRTAQPIHPTSLPDPSRVPYSGFGGRSPVGLIKQDIAGYSERKAHTINAAADIVYDLPFIKGLELGAKFNARIKSIQRSELNKPYKVWSFDESLITEDFDGYILQEDLTGSSFTKSVTFGGANDPRERLLWRLYGSYEKSFGNHNFNFLAFGEKEDNKFYSIFASRRDLLSPNIPQLGGTNDLTSIGGTGRDLEYTRVSFAGRLNYDFNNKYLFEATLRSDASSKFGPLVRWGYFPSVSVGWNLAKENFVSNWESLDELKLRLSYSQTGVDRNVSNTSFDYLTGFEELVGGIYILNGVQTPLIRTSGLVNELITWETTTLYNLGIDFTLFEGRVYGTTEVFYRYRDGLLALPLESVPSTFGANLPPENLEARSNRGFEFLIGNQGSLGDFVFNVSGGIAFTREKYEVVQEDINEDDPVQVKFNKRTGRWVNVRFGYKSDGLFNSQQEVDDYLTQYAIEDLSGSPKPGDIRYVDLNDDGIINREDRYEIGWGNDPQLTYNLTTSFKYKNFTLGMLWQGGSQFNVNIEGVLQAPFGNEQVPLVLHEKYAWRQDPANPGFNANPDAQIPAFERSGIRPWNNVNSDFWTKNGAYIRLKTATLNYGLHKKQLDKLKLDKLNIYLSGDNIVDFNGLGIYKGQIDPEEASSANTNAFNLPLLRTFSAGIQIGF